MWLIANRGVAISAFENTSLTLDQGQIHRVGPVIDALVPARQSEQVERVLDGKLVPIIPSVPFESNDTFIPLAFFYGPTNSLIR